MKTFSNPKLQCLEPDPLSVDIKHEFSERESLYPRPTFSLVPKIELKTKLDNTFQGTLDPLALNKDGEAHDFSSHSMKIKLEEQCHETSSISSFTQLPPAILTGELVPELKNDANVSLLMETLLPPSIESYQSALSEEQRLEHTLNAQDSNTLCLAECELEKFDTTLTQWSTSKEESCTKQKPVTQGANAAEIMSNTIGQKLEANSHETKMLETSIVSLNFSSKSTQILRELLLSTSQSKPFQTSKYGKNPEMIIGLCDAPVLPHSLQSPSCEEANHLHHANTERNPSYTKEKAAQATAERCKHYSSNQKHFTCADCSPEVIFINKKGLSLHIKTVHLKLFYFQCEKCGKVLDKRKKETHMSKHIIQPPTYKYSELEENKLKQVKQMILRPKIQKPVNIDQNLATNYFVKKKKPVRKKSRTEAPYNKNNSFSPIDYPKPIAEPQAEASQKDCDKNQQPQNQNQKNPPQPQDPGVSMKQIQVRSSPLRVEQETSMEKHHCTVSKGWNNDACKKVFGRIKNLAAQQKSYLDAFNNFCLQEEDSESGYMRKFPTQTYFKCPKCPKEFTSLYNCDRHFRAHHTEYTCNDCSPVVSYPKKYKLIRHIIVVHLKSHKFTCKICGDILDKKQKKKHMSIHDRKKIQCPHCQKNFPGVQKLMDHLKIHTENASFPCRYCVKHFEKRQEYVKHLRLEHSSERSIMCEYCGERFFTLTNLYTHTLMHTRKILFTCANCGRQFVHKHQLAAHVGTIACRQAALGSKGVIAGEKENKKLKSTTKNQFSCANCNERFLLKRQLTVHFKTKICEAQTSRSSKNTKSIVLHNNRAPLSESTYMQRKEKRKGFSKSKNPVVCANCKESFLLKRHLIVHLKTKVCETQTSSSSKNTKSIVLDNNRAPLSERTNMRRKEKRKEFSKSKNPVVCANCKESFLLKRHLIVHLKTKICETLTSTHTIHST